MEYPVKKVIVTGGTGGVGLALIQKLLQEKTEILLLQREHSAKKMYLPENPLLHVEYCDLEHLKDYRPTAQDYDVFFHLGWANTRRAMRDDMEEQNKNVMYSCEAVETARRAGCHSFIGAGSQAEYGRHEEPLREDTLCTPETAYGVMKLSACYATRNLCRKYGIRHIWSRILSGYGIYDNIDSMLISAILNSMDGKSFEFSKGEQIWDFTYMDDIANALLLIAEKGKDGSIYPIGSGNARPLKEFIQILCEKLGKPDAAEFGKIPYADTQIMHLEADISKLQEDTGWKPVVEFEDGIVRVIEFYKDWKEQWKPKWDTRILELEEEIKNKKTCVEKQEEKDENM